jgi:hypothetical protein
VGVPARLRPEVIIPLRSGAGWARTLLLSCCAFIMFVTTADALRYASQRETQRRIRIERPAAAPLDRDCAPDEPAAMKPAKCRATSSSPRPR